MIPNPPIPGDIAPTAEVLFDCVNTFAKAHGFGIVRRHAFSYKGRKVRYTFQCDRFGESRPARGAGLRQRKSRKCGCKWMVIAEAVEEGKWLLRQHSNPEHSQHNHERSMGPSAHPCHRRLTAAVGATVESTSRRVGIRARDVRAVIQEQHPESVFTRKDIYNARSRISHDKMNGYTPTAALIKLFDEKKIPYLIKWAEDNPNRLLGLVWTFPYCLRMWKRFPEVISFDNTYNTNRFKLPLFQATGQTCLGSVFNAAFGLIDNERREGFQFLSESIRRLLEQHSIRQPDVILTDFDDQMKAALDDQFPEVQQQLCIHHINSNVLLRSKQKWVSNRGHDSSSSGSIDGDAPPPETQVELSPRDRQCIHAPAADVIPHTYRGVLSMWKIVVFAETEEAHEKARADLCREFDDQRAILRYLHGTYMPVRAQWARCFIRRYRNFGIRVTSGTEASNNNVKSYLLNGMSHLHRLVEAIQDMIMDQERDFAHACAEDDILTARDYQGSRSEYLGNLRTTISSKGLGLIARQYLLARRAMPTRKDPVPDSLGPCGDGCSVSAELGIPCHHTIHSRIVSGTSFTKWDVHPRWHLRVSPSRDPYRRILDPKIATSLRGRPKNTPQAVPTRLAVATSTQSDAQPCGLPTNRTARGPVRKQGRARKRQKQPTRARSALQAGQQASSEVELSSQRQTSGQSSTLGAGRTTGARASGRRTQPSIRSRRSQWELVDSDSDGVVLPSIVVKT
ncbi:mutator-like element [Purpureocillium lilacinum]|uniref:Mutator-like element n=1 Tax=Purpureocillium lilacinum TaxID=33203 RepID=A0A179FFR4_PURLI|nr:mutator-like element [Purpureocillium lilacinum]